MHLLRKNRFVRNLRTTIALTLVGSLLVTSCKKYEEFQVNPNQSSTATPALLLTNICYSIFRSSSFLITEPAYAVRQLTYYERVNNYVGYAWREGSFGNYQTLSQVKAMDDLAATPDMKNYKGLAKLFRAILFSQLTDQFGDIPYSSALGASSGNVKPAYDTQEAVYKGILQELEEANSILSDANGAIGGDIIFDGKASQWQKLANALHLRLLIHLSKKESNTNLNIKSQFQAIVGNPTKYPLMSSAADNAQLVFNSSAANNAYPGFGNLSIASLVSLEKSFVKLLKDTKDVRLFAFGEPISGKEAGKFENYEGVDAGLTIGEQIVLAGSASKIKKRYYDDRINEPLIFLGYPEQEFLIAEAISRGWITSAGTASEHYENGIRASMKFYGIADATITDYLAGTAVKLTPDNALTNIALQKYIAMFLHSGLEPFYEQRRTGIPTLSVGPGTYNDKKVPKRWIYPQSEYDNNNDNVKTSTQAQFGTTNETINDEIWLLK
ncbi:SusD/RagB family nutrient-binding outer membrane lipoprotein [Spirosoma sp. SC4-14]|uniref:SusD/RagB family nutrient-binding outer membrane lipoprotein n=1 Tax=Spirosoma sp. SC4-14 TaxID=3128900 RepID=UPI0030D55A32